MQEIGVETSSLNQILFREKTVEIKLGKPEYLKIRVGDILSLREDIWIDGKLSSSIHDQGLIKIKQLLYFETLDEMISSINFKDALPSAKSKLEALKTYRELYPPEDEYEYGVIAMTFDLEES